MKNGTTSEITLPEMNGGLNTHDPEYAIADNQSPDMLNLWYKDMALSKRPGQVLLIDGCGGDVLDGGVYRISDPYNGYQAVHAGTKLYRADLTGGVICKGTFDPSAGYPTGASAGDYFVASAAGTIEDIDYQTGDRVIYNVTPGSETTPVWHKAVTEIKSGIQPSAGVFCEFGDRLYYLDGSEIWQISDSYDVTAAVPYEPVVMLNCKPDLSYSDDNEAYNLIGTGFCVKYNGDGASAVYHLPETGVDDAVQVSVDGVVKTRNAHFTFDASAGTVTFTSGNFPGTGTNNVWITAYKTSLSKRDKIAGCRVAVRFGGEAAGVVGGTRVFVTGNPDYPYTYWRSDLGLHVSYGMTYFPDTAEEVLDQNSEPITAAAKMGEQLILFKENSIFAVGYAFDGKDVYYPVRECHSAIGCDMPGSVQLIDNRLVFAHSKSGVHILADTNNELENIVKPLSANINALLLKEDGLQSACSCDWQRYYWLCVNGRVYLWDYDTTPYYNYADYDKAQRRLAWYRFDGINAGTFFADMDLYYGAQNGIVKFTGNKNDFDKAYSAYYKSKAFDLGRPDDLKTFLCVYPSFSKDGDIKAAVSVGNESTDCFAQRQYDIRSFDWGEFNWAAFTWERIKYAKTFRMRLGMKRAAFLQIKVEGGDKDRGVGLSGLRVTYFINRKVKR